MLLCALRRLALQYTQFSKAAHGTRKLGQAYEPEVLVKVREWISSALASPDLVLEARKFLKIGALVRTSLRRITFAIPLPLSALDLTFAYAQLTNAAAG